MVGQLDLQWIDAFKKRSLPAGAIGPAATLKEDAALLRVAPGLGYQVYSGGLAGVPITVDARAGFSVLTWDASAHFEGSPFPGVSVSHNFVQPWAGFRADFYPWRDWRFELGATVDGFGVNGGVWGWGASALISYSITRWLDVTGGFRALNSKGRGTVPARSSDRSILPPMARCSGSALGSELFARALNQFQSGEGSETTIMATDKSILTGLKRGFARSCPNCGEGRLFAGYLETRSPCEVWATITAFIRPTIFRLISPFWPSGMFSCRSSCGRIAPSSRQSGCSA